MPLPLLQRLGALAQKWTQRAIAAQPDYVQAVSRPEVAQLWKQKVVAAAPTYNQAMTQVVQQNVWGNTMQRVPAELWQQGVMQKADRRAQGIQLAQNKWAIGYQPIAQALDQVLPTLPARGPKMSDANINRFMTVIRTIHTAARQRRGVGVVAAQVQGPLPEVTAAIPPIYTPQPQVQFVTPQQQPIAAQSYGAQYGGSWFSGLR
jgi:hypothetical protein